MEQYSLVQQYQSSYLVNGQSNEEYTRLNHNVHASTQLYDKDTAVAVFVLIIIIAAVIVILSTFVILYKAKTRKCKFNKLYENVLTSYIQANG